MLHDGSAAYVYGHERLAAIAPDGTRTWYLGDALGSVRLRLDDAGAPRDAAAYTPFGIPHEAMPAPIGFTGELHDAGLVSLRARWYNPASGVFLSRDPFGGFATRPYSLHPYQYGYANPVVWTDPSGKSPADALEFLSGFFQQWAYVNSLGLARNLAPGSCESMPMTAGRHLGNVAGVLQGLIEIDAGMTMTGGGAAACLTGVGCGVGVPVAGAGLAVAGHGALVAGSALAAEGALILHAVTGSGDGEDGGGGSERNGSVGSESGGGRRTPHGQQRASQGDRPTRQAWNDAYEAGPSKMFYDTETGAYAVHGNRGRIHVFFKGNEGKLRAHTSYYSSSRVTSRKIKTGKWRPLSDDEYIQWRELLNQE